jgi:hypothetical protein
LFCRDPWEESYSLIWQREFCVLRLRNGYRILKRKEWLRAAFYGGGTWFLALRGERRLFGRTEQRGEATGCRKLHEKEITNLCSTYTITVIKSRMLRYVGRVAYMRRNMRITYKHSVTKSEGKKTNLKTEANRAGRY